MYIESHLNKFIPFLELQEFSKHNEGNQPGIDHKRVKDALERLLFEIQGLIRLRVEYFDKEALDMVGEHQYQTYRYVAESGKDFTWLIREFNESVENKIYAFLNNAVDRLTSTLKDYPEELALAKNYVEESLYEWELEFSNHDWARKLRFKRDNPIVIKTLEYNGKFFEVEVHWDGYIPFYGNKDLDKAPLELILGYNIDVELDKWLIKNSVLTEKEFLEIKILKISRELEISKTRMAEMDETALLNAANGYAISKIIFNIAEKKLKLFEEAVIQSATGQNLNVPDKKYDMILKYLSPFEEEFQNRQDFLKAIESILAFFNSKSVVLKNPLWVKHGNKKKLALVMGVIWRSQTSDIISYEYLMLYKQIFEIYKGQTLDKNNLFGSALYKYSISST